MGEARGASREFQVAVANVIKNRAALVGNDYSSVIKQPGQFSAMNPTDPNRPAVDATLQEGTVTDQVKNVVEGVYTGKIGDNTKGALLYYSPQSMDPSRSEPRWNFRVLTLTLELGDEGKFYRCSGGTSCWRRP
jgi:spore germination cell wall hydrolase CwlJ-like protein